MGQNYHPHMTPFNFVKRAIEGSARGDEWGTLRTSPGVRGAYGGEPENSRVSFRTTTPACIYQS